jgi:hypothetical protein
MFGLLKGCFQIQKTGIRLRGQKSADNMFLTRCILHDLLLKKDGPVKDANMANLEVLQTNVLKCSNDNTQLFSLREDFHLCVCYQHPWRMQLPSSYSSRH